jgi:hypothetical protein
MTSSSVTSGLGSGKNEPCRMRGTYTEHVGGVESIMSAIRLARCNCSAVRITTRGEPVRVAICHCAVCRREGGGAFAVILVWRAEDVTIERVTTTGRLRRTRGTYARSAGRRYSVSRRGAGRSRCGSGRSIRRLAWHPNTRTGLSTVKRGCRCWRLSSMRVIGSDPDDLMVILFGCCLGSRRRERQAVTSLWSKPSGLPVQHLPQRLGLRARTGPRQKLIHVGLVDLAAGCEVGLVPVRSIWRPARPS